MVPAFYGGAGPPSRVYSVPRQVAPMETQIVPCRAEISDRFPVASFAVNVPPARCFEVACATDPRLFHTDWQRYRSPRNFYSSRSEGLQRAPDGHTAWFIPAEQLRRFAGSQRIYYALATYENAYGGAPEFSISPDGLDRIPFISVAGDFTGRGLDRSRLGMIPPPPDAYGAVDAGTLTWGGDEALAAYRAAESAPGGGGEYDDGYPKELWHEGDPGAMAGQAGLGDGGWSHEMGAGCGDAYDDEAPHPDAVGAALGEPGPADSGTFDPDEGDGSALAVSHAAEGPADSGTFDPDDTEAGYDVAHSANDEYGEEDPPAEGYGAAAFDDGDDEDEHDEPYGGGYPDAAALYGHGADEDDELAGGYHDAAEINAGAAGLDDAGHDADEPPYEDGSGYGGYDDGSASGYGGGYDDGSASTYGTAYDDGSAYGTAYDDGSTYGTAYGDASDASACDDGAEPGYGGGYDPAASSGCEPAYGPAYGGGYDPSAEDDGGGVAVADPEVSQAQSAAPPAALTGRDPGYSDAEPEEEVLPVGHAVQALAVVPLDIAEKVRILRVVAKAESGAAGYTAINPDNEYNNPNHPAYHKYHIGLSWGFIQFTQRSGALGRVLAAIKRREDTLGAAIPAQHKFAALFGPDWSELLRITAAGTEEGRVAPVGGKVLWDPDWTKRFAAAGKVDHVTWSQNEIAVTDYVDPNLRFAHWLGFDTARALAMLFDRCIHMGNGGGTSWIMRSCGPIRTDEERRAALAALGHADLRAFQQSQAPHLSMDGRWGPKTHAALVAALRALGSRSPVAIPGRDALLQRLADASSGTGFHRRLTALHTNRADFDDATTYTLV